MENVGYYNGEVGLLEELKVPFLDRACYFGDGVYDATITSQGVILFEEDHIARFFNSCRLMEITPGITAEELSALLHELLVKMDATDTFLYWQVSRATAPRNHAFPSDAKANIWVSITPKPLEDLSWDSTAVTVEDTRFSHCNAKTLNLLPNVLAAQRAAEAGADEAILVRDGFVTECAHSNVHIIQDGALVTHPADNHILPGIGRKHLIASCERLGVAVQERLYTKLELMEAEEVIVSASSTFARGVRQIDGHPVGQRNRDLLRRLQAETTREFNEYIAAHRA